MTTTVAIAPGTTLTTYAFSNLTSAPKSIYLTPVNGQELSPNLLIRVMKKKSGNASYYEIGRLTLNNPAYICQGSGDFQLERPAQSVGCGADIESD